MYKIDEKISPQNYITELIKQNCNLNNPHAQTKKNEIKLNSVIKAPVIQNDRNTSIYKFKELYRTNNGSDTFTPIY